MRGEPSCPKCGGRVRAPGLFSDSWQCDVHGTVHPQQPVVPPSVEALTVAVKRAKVPVWMPWPLPVGWLFTGVSCAGDDRSGSRATVVACSGPDRSADSASCCWWPRSSGSVSARATRAWTGPTRGRTSTWRNRRRPRSSRPPADPACGTSPAPPTTARSRGRGVRAVGVGDRLAGAGGPADVRRTDTDRSARCGRGSGPGAVRGAVAAAALLTGEGTGGCSIPGYP